MEAMRVAVLLGPDFEDSEFQVPVTRLREAGVAIQVIGKQAGEELAGKKGKQRTLVERSIDQARPEEYDALLIPGGHSPDNLRADDRFVEFVRAFDATGRPLAAVCHGPQLLISAGLVKGRTLTAWKTVQEDLRQIGATVRDQEVVRDGNWITSRKPDDLEAFSEALLTALGERGARRAESEEDEPVSGPRDGGGQVGRVAARGDEDVTARLKRAAAAESNQSRSAEGGSPRGKL
jgi:protease I